MIDATIFSVVILRLVSSVRLYLRKSVQVVPASRWNARPMRRGFTRHCVQSVKAKRVQ